MFKKKKSKQEVCKWEQEDIYRKAINRLTEMEANPDKYDYTEKEGDLLAQLKLSKDRLESATERKKKIESEIKELKRTGGEWEVLTDKMDTVKEIEESMTTLRDNILTLTAELEAIKGRNPLEEQREFVRKLAEQKLAWQKENAPKARPVDHNIWVAAGISVIGMVVPFVGHEIGKLWNHIPFRTEQPRMWK